MRESAIQCKETVLKADELMKAGTPFICFDFETTGTSVVADRPVSISAIKIAMRDGLPEEIGRLDLLINPGFHIPDEASAINHIKDEDVENAPKEDEAFQQIKRFFGEKPFLCGYNSRTFDMGFMSALYGRQGETITPIIHVDVYDMAKEKLDMSSYKLEKVAHELGVDAGIEFHNSIDDCIATFRAFTILMKEYTNPDPEKEKKVQVKVKGVSHWQGASHTLDRVYIKTEPYTKTYYDAYRKEWRSDIEIDTEKLKKDVFEFCHVTTENEMVRVAKSYKNS